MDYSKRSLYKSHKELLEKTRLERSKVDKFSFGNINSCVETREEFNNDVLFAERRHRYFDVGELRKLQVPGVGSQPLRELLKCLHKPPMLEGVSPECRILVPFGIYHCICRTDNACPRRYATCALPHSHRIVNDVTCDNALIVAFVLAGTVLLLGIGLPSNAEVDSNGKQFILIAATLGTFVEDVSYLDCFPFRQAFPSLTRDTQIALKYGTLNTSFMLLEEAVNKMGNM